MEVKIGQIVFSRKGRDISDVYMVVGTEGDRVLLADGQKKTLAQPKRKNLRHIAPTGTVLLPAEADSDSKLRAALAGYLETCGLETQGG